MCSNLDAVGNNSKLETAENQTTTFPKINHDNTEIYMYQIQ